MSAKEIYKMSSADGNNYDDDNDNSSELTSESSPPDLPVDLSQYKREHEKAAADGLLSLSTTQK